LPINHTVLISFQNKYLFGEEDFLQTSRSRRGRFEIIAEILLLCRRPQGKTRVMYETNLSYSMLQMYLNNLIALKLIEVHHSKKKYATTQKGTVFLQKWLSLSDLLTEEQTFKDKSRSLDLSKGITATQAWSYAK
jgi:predicted transcriptional regulator